MKIENLEQVIKIFRETAIIHIDSQYDGNWRLVNKTNKELSQISEFIKIHHSFEILLPFLNDKDDKDDKLKFIAAVELLQTEYRELALNLLKKLSQSNSKMANKSFYALEADKDFIA